MATDVERLVVSMEAKLSKFDRDLRKAVGMSDRTARSIETRFSKMEKRVSATGAALARNLIAPLAGALAAREVIGMADAYTRLTNSLKFANVPAAQVNASMERLLATANKAGVGIEGVVGLFAKMASIQDVTKASTDEMYKATENISLIMGAAGADTATMSAAMLQLGQAFGSARVEWEEVGALMDTAPALMKAAANGIEEAGGSTSKFTALVKDGKLSGEAFFRAILIGSQEMATRASDAPQTFAQRLVVLRNEMTSVIGKMNEGTGATGELNQVMDRLSSIIKDPAFQQGLLGIAQSIGAIGVAAAETIRAIGSLGRWLEDLAQRGNAGLSRATGGFIPNTTDTLENRFNFPSGANDPALFSALQKKAAAAGGNLIAGPATYPSAMPLGALGAAPVGKTSGGGTGGTKDPWETMWGLGIGREQAIEATKKAQEELNAKIEEGKQITTDFLQTFVGGMMEGKKATEAMRDALNSLSKMLMDKALEQAVSQIFGMFTGALGGAPTAPPGGYTGLIPHSFGGFRASGGPVSAGRGYMVGENGPELFVPRASGSITPNGGPPIVEISVRRGEMFEPVVSQLAGSQADIRIRRNNDALASARRHGVKGV